MRPSELTATHRDLIVRVTAMHRTRNPRLFGSVLNGSDTEFSDLDLLVDPLPDTTLFDLGAIQMELEAALGIVVDLRTPGDLPPGFRDSVLNEARPIQV